MRAARYVRVSTDRQATNTSIPNQLERTAAYIEAQGWELVATFTEPGESGENLNRPALTAARQAVQRGELGVLVVYTLDRLTRDIDDLFLLRREFKAKGVRAQAVHDGLEVTTADIDDLLGVLFTGYFTHRERQVIIRRMREGVEHSVRAGRHPGGVVPYGYRRSAENRLEIDEEAAKVVRLIFKWYTEESVGIRQVARRLIGLGIPTPTARRGQITLRRATGTRLVSKWTPGSVSYILHQEIYSGRWTFRRNTDSAIACDVPAIIDQRTWDKVQHILESNRHRTRPPKYKYLLRGLIRCECGLAYAATPSQRKDLAHYYRCPGRHRWDCQGERPCNGATVVGPELDAAVWDDIERFIRQPHLVATELAKRRASTGTDIAVELAGVDQSISERKAELDRYLTLYGRGTIPVEQLDAKADEVRGSVATLEAYRAGLVREQRRADLWEQEIVGVVEALEAIQVRLDAGLPWEQKRHFVELLVKGILIETLIDESGKRCPVAHVTYKFERPAAEAPIPIELEPLFLDAGHFVELSRTAAGPGQISKTPFTLERDVEL